MMRAKYGDTMKNQGEALEFSDTNKKQRGWGLKSKCNTAFRIPLNPTPNPNSKIKSSLPQDHIRKNPTLSPNSYQIRVFDSLRRKKLGILFDMATPEMEQLEREIREMEEERMRELQEMEEERTRRAEVFAKNDADWEESKQISDENWAALQASSDELLQILDGEIEVDFSDERTSLQARIVELEEKLETALSDVTKAQADPAALEPKLRRANLAVAAGRQTQIQLRFLRRWILDILRRV